MHNPDRTSGSNQKQLEQLWLELHGQVRRRFGTAASAEDVVQEAWVHALRRPPPDPRGLAGWLGVVAHRLAVRRRWQERSRGRRERAVAVDESYWPTAPDAGEKATAVLRLLDSLPDPYREVLRLHYLEGLAIEEVARRLSRSQGTVRSQMKRGLDRLRVLLGVDADGRRDTWGAALLALRARFWRHPARVFWARASVGLGLLLAVSVVLLLQERPSRRTASQSLAQQGSDSVASVQVALLSSEAAPRVPQAGVRVPAPATALPEWAVDLAGIVLDAERRPAAGVPIFVGEATTEATAPVAWSDESGRFQVGGADGRRWIWAAHPMATGSERHLIGSATTVEELELQLGAPFGSALIRVLDADGTPVLGADVTHLGPTRHTANSNQGPQGTIVLPPPPVRLPRHADGVHLQASATGGAVRFLVSAQGEPPAMIPCLVHAGQELELRLPRAGSLSGVLLSKEGIPLARAGLRLSLGQPLPACTASTDAKGAFRFEDLPPGRFELTLIDGPEGSAAESLSYEGTLGEGEDLFRTVRCGAESVIRGRARRDGKPLGGWTVRIRRFDSLLFPDQRDARTDPQGRFAFRSCSMTDTYSVLLLEPGSESPSVWAEAVRSGGPELELAPSQAGIASLKGTITTDASESPVVLVELRNARYSIEHLLRVDPHDGSFTAESLAPLDYAVTALVSGSGPWKLESLTLTPGQAAELQVRLPAAGELEIELELPPGMAPERIEVGLSSRSIQGAGRTGFRTLRADASGLRFSARCPPGKHEFKVLLDGQSVERPLVDIESGSTVQRIVVVPEDVVRVLLTLRTEVPIDRDNIVLTSFADRERRLMVGQVSSGTEDEFWVLLPRHVERLVVEGGNLAGEWVSEGIALEEEQRITVELRAPEK